MEFYCTGKEQTVDSIISVLENIWRYLTLIRITDVLDISIMSFAIYKLLRLCAAPGLRISSRGS